MIPAPRGFWESLLSSECARSAHESDPTTPIVVTPPLYNTGMMNNDSSELYATLARINAALAAQEAERLEWIEAYDKGVR